MTTVSIIMPVYNGAKFLQRSFESILKQTLNDFEVVFVNDGSSDNSLEVLEGFEREHSFVKILNQKNSGSGKARNYGIEEASGEYIAFLDADDFFMDEDCLEKMYNFGHENDANMVTANIKHDLKQQGKFVPFGPFYYYKSNDIIRPEQYGIPWSFYKNIFKKEFLTKNKIVFPDLLRGQDPVFLAEVLTKVDKIYAVATDIYAYVYNSDTAKASNYRKLYDQLLHYKMVFDYFDNPIFKKRQNEYFYKIFLFMGRLDDDSSLDALKAIREIFNGYPEFKRRLENWLYLKFKDNEKFMLQFDKYPKVSVITPVYNNEQNITDYLDCVAKQDLDDIEIIFVDAKSNDETAKIIKEYMKNDLRIKLFAIDTNDYALALNTGLENADGDYIYFGNALDYLFENALGELFRNAVLNGSDITLFNLANYKNLNQLNFNSGYDFKKEKLGNIDYNFYTSNYNYIKDLLFDFNYGNHYKLYRKEFLLGNNIKFITGSVDYEVPVHLETLVKAKRISYVPKYLCYHKVLNIEIPHYNQLEYLFSRNNINLLNVFNIFNKIRTVLEENGLYGKYGKLFTKFILEKILLYLEYSHFNMKELIKNDKLDSNESITNLFFDKAKETIKECNLKYTTPYIYKKAKMILDSEDYNEYNIKSQEYDCIRLQTVNKQLIHENSKMLKNNREIETQINKLKKENNKLRNERKQFNKKINKFKHENDEMFSSNSWKMTKFLRRT